MDAALAASGMPSPSSLACRSCFKLRATLLSASSPPRITKTAHLLSSICHVSRPLSFSAAETTPPPNHPPSMWCTAGSSPPKFPNPIRIHTKFSSLQTIAFPLHLSQICASPHPSSSFPASRHTFPFSSSVGSHLSTLQCRWVASAAASGGGAPKMPSRLLQKEQFLQDKTGQALSEEEMNAPIPQIGEEHVTVSFARSGGPGGQNVNKVATKVDMRFNVYNAEWLPDRIRLKILDQESNRINGDGELVVSSTKTRTQRGNIQDALEKMQKIIDAAAYVPPPPSEEKKARIKKLAKAENERRLEGKKMKSSKKSDRRNKGSWD